MSANTRNRVVVFRLSQDEYLKLKAASARNGARNLSDFTRGEVLTFLNSQDLEDRLDRKLNSIEHSLAQLQDLMLRLQSAVVGS